MLQLSEQAQQEWKNYIDIFAEALNSPEHIQAVHEFVSVVKKESISTYNGKRALVNLIHSIEDAFHVKINEVVVNNSDKAAGAYQPYNKTVAISSNYKNIANLLTTIYHEMRHALQFQFLMNGKTEFSKILFDEISNYKLPDSTLIGDVDYISNLAEEDAVIFSMRAFQEVINDLMIAPTEKEEMLSDFNKLYNDKIQSISVSETFKTVSNYATQMYVKDYGDALTYIFKSNEPKSVKNLKLGELLKAVETKYASFNQAIRKNSDTTAAILKYIFDNCSMEELARNIDDPNVELLEAMERSKGVAFSSQYSDSKISGTYFGSRFGQLRDFVHLSKDMLETYKIPFDKNDKGKMFMTFLEFAPELNAGLFERHAKHKMKPTDKSLERFITSLYSYKLVKREDLIKKIINKFGMNKITSWYNKILKLEENKNESDLKLISIMGIRLQEFEQVSEKMKDSEEPKKTTWKTIFGGKKFKDKSNSSNFAL